MKIEKNYLKISAHTIEVLTVFRDFIIRAFANSGIFYSGFCRIITSRPQDR
jgi:hypothetical protein